MKSLLVFSLLLGSLSASAQIVGKSIPEYTSKRGTVIHKGDTLRMAMGKADNGSYRYAFIPANGWVGTAQVQLNSSWNNLRPIVKDIREQQTRKNMGSRTVAVVSTGGINACVDIDSAEESGEITTKNNQTKATPTGGGGVADELLKLKALLDAGALTQAEYDGQKAKLLAR